MRVPTCLYHVLSPVFSSIWGIDEKPALDARSYVQSFAPLSKRGAKDNPCGTNGQAHLHHNLFEGISHWRCRVEMWCGGLGFGIVCFRVSPYVSQYPYALLPFPRSRFIEPAVRISCIRLSDKVAYALAHGRSAVNFSSLSRPSSPYRYSSVNLFLPCP